MVTISHFSRLMQEINLFFFMLYYYPGPHLLQTACSPLNPGALCRYGSSCKKRRKNSIKGLHLAHDCAFGSVLHLSPRPLRRPPGPRLSWTRPPRFAAAAQSSPLETGIKEGHHHRPGGVTFQLQLTLWAPLMAAGWSGTMKNLGVWLVVEAGTSEDGAVWVSGRTCRLVPGVCEDPPGVVLGSHCQDLSSSSSPRLLSDTGVVGEAKGVAVRKSVAGC